MNQELIDKFKKVKILKHCRNNVFSHCFSNTGGTVLQVITEELENNQHKIYVDGIFCNMYTHGFSGLDFDVYVEWGKKHASSLIKFDEETGDFFVILEPQEIQSNESLNFHVSALIQSVIIFENNCYRKFHYSPKLYQELNFHKFFLEPPYELDDDSVERLQIVVSKILNDKSLETRLDKLNELTNFINEIKYSRKEKQLEHLKESLKNNPIDQEWLNQFNLAIDQTIKKYPQKNKQETIDKLNEFLKELNK